MGKKILIITDSEFWKEDNGTNKRISQFIEKISSYGIKIEIAFIGKVYHKEKIEKIYQIIIHEIGTYKKNISLKLKDLINKFPKLREKIRNNLTHTTIKSLRDETIIKIFNKNIEINKYDVVIVEYIWLDYLLNSNYKGIKIIDTIDVQSDRFRTYQSNNQF
ncbi:MAG: hypothetical protein LBT51_04610, partial [Fusobacteriaceae bacterium]|nr:hypothetical protein [Fusobacteriaceae bacterium]